LLAKSPISNIFMPENRWAAQQSGREPLLSHGLVALPPMVQN
jgi:hypothetical protein